MKETQCLQLTENMYHINVTFLFTPWCRVLEKLAGLQLVKKFPALYGTRRFISAFKSALHLSLLHLFLQFSAPLPTCFTPLGSSSGAYLYIHSLCTPFLKVYDRFSFYIVFERTLCNGSVNERVLYEMLHTKNQQQYK